MARDGFDANSRAQARERSEVKLGDAVYHPARLTNKRLRQVRGESQRGQSEARAAAKDTEEYKKAWAEAKDAGRSDDDARIEAEQAGSNTDVYSDVIDLSLAKQFSMLLVDEGVQHPSEEIMLAHINDDLDTRDLDSLMGYLVGPDEEETPSAPVTTS